MVQAFIRGTACAAAILIAATPAFAQDQAIRVGVTAGPHAEVLDVVRKTAAECGFNIKVVEFTDYVVPNQALAGREIEATPSSMSPI